MKTATTTQFETAVKKQEEIENLKKELSKYQKGFNEVMCYFDSISDEEQPKLLKRLTKIGL